MFCNEKATIFYTQIVQGQMKKVCLCEECANEQGIMNPEGFSLADIIMKAQPQQAQLVTEMNPSTQCDHCGFTLQDLRKVGRLGCSHCYVVFRGEILPMLDKMHKGATHVGRAPEGMLKVKQVEKNLADQKQELELAIKAENFEEAARLRDAIKTLETELTQIQKIK